MIVAVIVIMLFGPAIWSANLQPPPPKKKFVISEKDMLSGLNVVSVLCLSKNI